MRFPVRPQTLYNSLSESVKRLCEAASSRASKKPISHLPLTSHGSSASLIPAPSDFLRHSFPQSNSRPKIALKRSSPYALRSLTSLSESVKRLCEAASSRASKKPISHLPLTSHGCTAWLIPPPSDFPREPQRSRSLTSLSPPRTL